MVPLLRTRVAILAAALPVFLSLCVQHRVVAFSPRGLLLPRVRRSHRYRQQMIRWHRNQTPTISSTSATSSCLSSLDIQAKLKAQMAKLQQRDRKSRAISPDELDILYEDEHIAVVNKGVLTVPGKEDNPSINKSAFERFGCKSDSMDKMAVHRLGTDTSGIVVFARTDAALRALNGLFCTQNVTRKYEALLCRHVEYDEGVIDLPLMRDYRRPPYMRLSTEDHQGALVGLDPEKVGKKILESPKPSITGYRVIAREGSGGYDVTRLEFTSVSGRTHQLNVHCAAIGHPIVGDTVYGHGDEALANGGLEESTLPEDRASEDFQKGIAESYMGNQCVYMRIRSALNIQLQERSFRLSVQHHFSSNV